MKLNRLMDNDTNLDNHNGANQSKDVPVEAVTIVLVFIIIVCVAGNLLVCSAFVIQPRLRRALYFPVLSLAVADVMCGAVAMPSYLAKKHVFGGKKEQIVCDISRFSYFLTEYASVFSLMIISVDRALAIIKPLTYKTTVTSKRMKVVLGCAWCWAIIVSALPFFWKKDDDESCYFKPTNEWSIAVILVNVLLPFVVILTCQTSIYIIAIKHAIIIKKQRMAGTFNQNRRGSTPRTDAWAIERKATVSLSIVIGLFILCWGPSSLYYFLQKVNPDYFEGTFGENEGTFNAVVKLMTFANSCFNPFVYSWMSRDFREGFIRVLTRKKYRNAVEKQASYTASHHELLTKQVSKPTMVTYEPY
ncbi:dopamine receptor 4-like isoform X2 [Dendronephthya gigantea]|uniref:dopamine receptor 4-like isoform X2 n=1 Tax=Dendronephthya gigantea TaxID=151771 RepID=UPI00106C2BA0|nr:dopamine receptor 4-like isoform X2 [Dendronephthya gigantea]